jgi:putative Mg2+ transporter-C (MgtC) family protein
MPLSMQWPDLLLRFALTVVAGVLLGYNRAEHGKAAGISTTVLVGIAAAVAMMQVNVLLPLAGRAANSFVMNDLMRLPLGILTGVGFIGGGAILRRGDLVVGVTTAATLWLVTVIGLCFGGGQITLGVAATAVGLFALWGLKWFEHRMRRERRARLEIQLDPQGPTDEAIRDGLQNNGLVIVGRQTELVRDGNTRTLVFDLVEECHQPSMEMPAFLATLASQGGVVRVGWRSPA